jgi:hypothetical protein
MKATLGGVPSVGHTLATSRGRMKVELCKGVRKNCLPTACKFSQRWASNLNIVSDVLSRYKLVKLTV